VTRRLAPLLALLLVLAPELARACAVCGAGVDDDQSRLAYLATTIAMSALPLALLGGFLLWLRAKQRRQAGSRVAESGVLGQGSPEPK
jgi:hypothetical protein